MSARAAKYIAIEHDLAGIAAAQVEVGAAEAFAFLQRAHGGYNHVTGTIAQGKANLVMDGYIFGESDPNGKILRAREKLKLKLKLPPIPFAVRTLERSWEAGIREGKLYIDYADSTGHTTIKAGPNYLEIRSQHTLFGKPEEYISIETLSLNPKSNNIVSSGITRSIESNTAIKFEGEFVKIEGKRPEPAKRKFWAFGR